MPGLNDSFLIADDSMEPKDTPLVVNAFKENADDSAEPELRDDLDLIAVATEDFVVQMRDLDLLQQNIQEQGGMSQSIALEAHVILPDFLNDERPIGFFTKHPSRTQLTAALEDINNGKKNVVMRMIDTILGFIKRILKKIKDFFIVDQEAIKQEQEFAKNYKGQKAEAKAKATGQQAQGQAQANGQAAPAADADQDDDHAETAQEHRRKWDEKLALIAAMLGKDRLVIIAALMSSKSNLRDDFGKALEAADNLLAKETFDNHGTLGDELHSLTQSCNAALAEATTWSDKLQRDLLDGWISAARPNVYMEIVGWYDEGRKSARFLPTTIADFLEDLQKEIESLKSHPDDQECVKKLKDNQKLVSELASFISLMAKINSAYSTMIKGLKK